MTVVHYNLHWHGRTNWAERCYIMACGAHMPFGYINRQCSVDPSEVRCTACEATAVFQEDLITIEIAFDGSLENWINKCVGGQHE